MALGVFGDVDEMCGMWKCGKKFRKLSGVFHFQRVLIEKVGVLKYAMNEDR